MLYFGRKSGDRTLSWEKRFVNALDIDASYRLAKKMEGPKTNPVLGYRTAGSAAELETGELLAAEMRRIGLKNVHKDRIQLDSWEFRRAVMRFQDEAGKQYEFQLGSYQTEFDTNGFQTYQVVYAGKGTAKDYESLDAAGKLVLVEMNQREEWWINYPVYQAHLKGAAAVLAVQEGGYGEISSRALNAQDIAGPADAPAFSISQADAAVLKRALEAARENGKDSVTVEFDAESHVRSGQESYNIIGTIPGRDSEEMILLSAHYDSYFSGFQDDNAAVAMMLGIAAGLIKIGYQPERTLVFCAMAAEEWGCINSKYDWSVGAYEQVFTVHPDWPGRMIADLNFELPAHAHGKKDAIRSTYEYSGFLEEFLKTVPEDSAAFPEGVQVLCPIETWSDDFSMAISGIPSMVNDFSAGLFMETHYHSQFDNEDFYDPAVYRFHHELYGRLVLALDRLKLPPLDFGKLFSAVETSIREGKEGEELLISRLREAREAADDLYCRIKGINDGAEIPVGEKTEIFKALLSLFKKSQDYFVRLDWQDCVLFPQEAAERNLSHLNRSLDCLKEGDVKGALDCLYGIDNNAYAFLFEEAVFSYFTDYVLNQPRQRLRWGAGRIVHHENLYRVVTLLQEHLSRENAGDGDLEEEKKLLQEAAARQEAYYRDDIRYITESVEKMTREINEIKRRFDYGQ